ncbi:YrhB domain-containing protein [Actinomadura rudentiformis]|uniref:Immunity protein 35 domain-containing protein n=1 Tax=Actinomadura rudentiformis TaxID=359158 RepID=A0A6H9YSB5_9ACTN|nr:YrhB domain-containing protein [Actinomadura rudentiformis]KAB2343939.1 hypothetical protein F8566_31810 [Actinomadura rudentiformis]
MDIKHARTLAERYLTENSPPSRPTALFEDDLVEDHGWCFVFPWNTARYVETRNMADIIGPGFGPIVVVKKSGETWMMSGFPPPEQQLSAYAASHGISDEGGA